MLASPAFRLSALSAATFAGIGIYMPFFPIWLESRGITPGAIGILVAIPLVVRIIATAPLVSLTERGIDARYLLAGAQIVLATLYTILLGLDSVWTIGLVVACIALAQAPLTPTSDLLTTDAVRANPGWITDASGYGGRSPSSCPMSARVTCLPARRRMRPSSL
jgi:PPP family 3-phenylpropionic acid transporter